jgi:hypothetical protein
VLFDATQRLRQRFMRSPCAAAVRATDPPAGAAAAHSQLQWQSCASGAARAALLFATQRLRQRCI